MSLEQRPVILLAEDDGLVAFTCEQELCDADSMSPVDFQAAQKLSSGWPRTPPIALSST